MRRRSALRAVAASLGGLAGCADRFPTGTADGDARGVADSFDGDVDRPECEVESETVEVTVGDETREEETAATVPYPDPPTEFTEGDVVEWIPSFEEAYVSHDVLCERSGSGHVLRVDYRTDRTDVLDGSGDVLVVYLRYAGGATAGVDDGVVWEADIDFTAVSYAVDETGAARVEFDRPLEPGHEEFESERRDPIEEGTLVAAFD
ncbi:hypothetical protein U4E84_03060 [Halorubrum sp. AD140]|uniref:hypothetical protein n=1 Tax=Halorubrum sp. AD140 TaxID=3050073 RepID=UPI002ACCC912|nr:hypothetical protein [Halorubrum sp. AD140]MDZ5810334.1 hypothetical protein [Halorubrum sp. AD140]